MSTDKEQLDVEEEFIDNLLEERRLQRQLADYDFDL
jgi:hypothetical protein